ncbi:uncharacterized protein [Mobula birostris]|uniref:uncharacterized protein isoform X5 n=1 Tax=Mobula birostris TaxID=1983395 RepID=UPI003B282E70
MILTGKRKRAETFTSSLGFNSMDQVSVELWSHMVLVKPKMDIRDQVTSETNLLKSETEAAKKWANRWGFLVTQRNQSLAKALNSEQLNCGLCCLTQVSLVFHGERIQLSDAV